MKTLKSWLNGAITITEQGGALFLNFNGALGGGDAAGIVQGSGSIKVDGNMGLHLAEGMINSHLSGTGLAIAQGAEALAESAVKSVE